MVVDLLTTKARHCLRPFAMRCTVTKGLAGDSSGRRQERGGGEHNNYSAKRGMHGKDASSRGDATGNYQTE
jgi:hypothetical protein